MLKVYKFLEKSDSEVERVVVGIDAGNFQAGLPEVGSLLAVPLPVEQERLLVVINRTGVDEHVLKEIGYFVMGNGGVNRDAAVDG